MNCLRVRLAGRRLAVQAFQRRFHWERKCSCWMVVLIACYSSQVKPIPFPVVRACRSQTGFLTK